MTNERVAEVAGTIMRAAEEHAAELEDLRGREDGAALAEYARRLGATAEETAAALASVVRDAVTHGAESDNLRRLLAPLDFADACKVAERAGITVSKLAAWYEGANPQ